MPKLPFYDRAVKSEALNPAAVRAPGPTGLDALGAGIAKAGGVVADIADKEIRQAEDTQINNFEVEYDRVSGDIKRRLAERKGEAAFLPGEEGKPPPDEEARQALAATRERLLETLVPSNRAREMAAERSKRTLVRHTAEVDDYAAGQRDVAFRASEDAARGMREQTLAREYDVPGRAAEIIGEAMRRERASAKSAEAGEAAAFEARKRLHGIVLDRYLDPTTGDAQKAHEYFATAKTELGTEARVYEAAVKSAVDKRKAASEADYLLEGAKAPMPEDSAQPLNEYDGSGYPDPVRVLDQINLRPAGPETDALRREVYARLADTEKARKAQQAQQYGAALNEFQGNGFRVDKISPKLWASIQAHDYEGAAKLKAADADAREKEARLARAHAKGRGAGNAEAKRLAAEQEARNKDALNYFRGLPPEEQAALDSDEKVLGWAIEKGMDQHGAFTLFPERKRGRESVDAGDNTRVSDFVDAYTEKIKGFAALSPAKKQAHQADARRLYAGNGGKDLPLVKFEEVIVKAIPVEEKGPGILSYHPFALAAGAASALYDKATAPPAAPVISDDERAAAAKALPGRSPAEIEAIILANRKANGQ